MCSFRDNGTAGFLVDNTGFGYTWNVQTGGNFSQIVDPTTTFTGGTRVDVLDGFLLWNIPGTNEFGSTELNSLTFNGTLIGTKDGYPDSIAALIVNRRELLLIGSGRGSEIWYNAGNPLFAFAILPGAYIEWGTPAPYSVVMADVDVFWIGQNEMGTGVILRQRGYNTSIISNYAISYAMQQMPTLTDAVGYSFARDGHIFVVFTFPSGDQTWVYDASVNDPKFAWHQLSYTDGDGAISHRHRVVSAAFVNQRNIGQDWQNGTLYTIDPDYFYDDVDMGDGAGAYPRGIARTRTFPGVKGGSGPRGLEPLDGKAVVLNKFLLDFQCGDGLTGPNNVPPSVSMRLSVDRGRTFGQNILQSTAEYTENGDFIEASYRILPQWQNLGIGRWPVFEVSWSFAGPAAMGGAWIDVEKGTS